MIDTLSLPRPCPSWCTVAAGVEHDADRCCSSEEETFASGIQPERGSGTGENVTVLTNLEREVGLLHG